MLRLQQKLDVELMQLEQQRLLVLFAEQRLDQPLPSYEMVEENRVTEIQIQEFVELQENQLPMIFHDQPVPVKYKSWKLSKDRKA